MVGDPVEDAPAHHREYGFANPSGAIGTSAIEFVIDRTRLGFSGAQTSAAPALSPDEAAARWAASGDADAVQWLGHSSVRLRHGRYCAAIRSGVRRKGNAGAALRPAAHERTASTGVRDGWLSMRS